jgi:hypothetical protein
LGIISAIDNAKKTVFIATRLPELLSPLRTAFSRAKNRGVKIELHTTKTHAASFEPFSHYMEICSALPSSEALVENLSQVLRNADVKAIGMDPDSMSIMVIDGIESVGIFRTSVEGQRPWALHIRNPLIVMIQWQVIKTTLYAIDGFVKGAMK